MPENIPCRYTSKCSAFTNCQNGIYKISVCRYSKTKTRFRKKCLFEVLNNSLLSTYSQITLRIDSIEILILEFKRNDYSFDAASLFFVNISLFFNRFLDIHHRTLKHHSNIRSFSPVRNEWIKQMIKK